MTYHRLRGVPAAYLVFSLGALALLPSSAHSALPPLVDRELFFSEPEISDVQISPDGQFIAFLRPVNGIRNIWVKQTTGPFEKARPITSDSKRPVDNYFWSRDGRYILFVQDVDGNENFNVFAVDPHAAPAAGHSAPVPRNLTATTGARCLIYATPTAAPDTIYVGINDRDKAWHDLYAVQISTGQRVLLRRNDLRATDWVFDLSGNLRLAVRSADNGDDEILSVGEKGYTKIYSCSVSETCAPLQFHKDGKRFYMASNRGADVNFTRLVLIDAQNGSEELVETDPDQRVDLERALFSPRTHELIATIYVDDAGSRWLWRDAVQRKDFELLRSKLPNKDIDIATTADEKLWIVHARADVEPGETYVFDRRVKKLTLQYRALPTIPRAWLAHTTTISYASADGLRIPAYLTLPRGVEPKLLPTIVFPHGGPWARDQWGYMSFAQFFANRGFAVLQPNFRGSTGYGKKFLNAGNREFGDKMQDDLTWGVRYLVQRGIADPRRVGIFGTSYGGYAALAGVAFTPELYNAAVSWVGPSNLPMVLESLSAFAEPARKMFYERIGNPTTADGRARLERQSPLNSISRIGTPLLVIQGANDPRVKQADSDRIVLSLHQRGVPVDYLLARDEGHVLGLGLGFAHPVNNQAIFAAIEKFFAKYSGTPYQEGMNAAVAQRLRELTVDPATIGQ